MNTPAPPVIPAKESYTSDIAHAQLLSSRVQFQNGVWIVDDYIRQRDKFMVSWVELVEFNVPLDT